MNIYLNITIHVIYITVVKTFKTASLSISIMIKTIVKPRQNMFEIIGRYICNFSICMHCIQLFKYFTIL